MKPEVLSQEASKAYPQEGGRALARVHGVNILRSASKFYDDELRAYVKEHPDATLEDIAQHFGGI